ncbi:MAG: hypothetical protein IJK22_04720 [Bacteroidales bacterium]|nr:hypothetical protein [Bacteroidales bacterium]
MKRFTIFLMSLFVLGAASAQNSDDYKAFIKERKAVQKLVKQERDEKVSKEAKKMAKKYAKEGWKVTVGTLPLEKQLEKSFTMQYELDMNNSMPKYIRGEGKAISTSYDAAKMHAIADAKVVLAGNIQTEVAAIIEERLANHELGKEEAVAISNAVQVSKQVIVQSIGRVITVVECYRELKNKNYEVLVHIYYNGEMAAEAAKKAVREDLEKKGDKLAKELDELLGF